MISAIVKGQLFVFSRISGFKNPKIASKYLLCRALVCIENKVSVVYCSITSEIFAGHLW